MKTSINEGNPIPTAHITVNKNRIKQYPTQGSKTNNTTTEEANYYLQDGQTFEIELFNPTQDKIKAEISIDGKNISQGGLVIKPGERVYLERFLESNNKFLFETYEVEGDNPEVTQAISQNGKLRVQFYREMKRFHLYDYTLPQARCCGGLSNKLVGSNITYYTQNTGVVGVPDIQYDTNNITLTSTNSDTTLSLTSINSGYVNQSTSNDFLRSDGTLSNQVVFDSMETMVNETAKIETGRVEKGETSNQEFVETNDTFSYYPFATVVYKLLPMSQQPITKETLTEVRKYCHECGSKTKPKFKFCPACGEKL